MPSVAVILPAAGQSRRFHDKYYKKPFAQLGGKAVWLHAAERFLSRSEVQQVIVVIAQEDREEFARKFGANLAFLGVEVCEGGAHRSDSVERALQVVKPEIDLVAVHDTARPCFTDPQLDAVFAAADRDGAAILAVRVAATLKRDDGKQRISATVDRSGLWEAQTPQVFRRELLLEAYAARDQEAATDDAGLVEKLGRPVRLVEGSALNIKITTREDLKLAEQILKVLPRPKPDGMAHPFADDDLWR
jgi:2-C-methyl-D-erythritol 4-phosphate cytidylyltransferase